MEDKNDEDRNRCDTAFGCAGKAFIHISAAGLMFIAEVCTIYALRAKEVKAQSAATIAWEASSLYFANLLLTGVVSVVNNVTDMDAIGMATRFAYSARRNCSNFFCSCNRSRRDDESYSFNFDGDGMYGSLDSKKNRFTVQSP